jgi:hypothetical protein
MKNFSQVAVLLIVVAGSATADDNVNRLEEFREKCTAYGFTAGTDAYSSCVQRLDQEVQADNRQKQKDVCLNIKRQADYWCSETPWRQGLKNTAAMQCSSLMATLNQNCPTRQR